MADKPIIRHCRNCQWYIGPYLPGLTGDCDVKYEQCFNPRRKALFCRFYKKKEKEVKSC